MAARPILLRVALILVGLMLVAACSDQGFVVVRVHNGLDEPIHIWAEPKSRPVFDVSAGRDIQPGDADVIRYDIFPGSTCADGALIARAVDGRELARSSGQVCPGDSWEVDGSGFHSSPRP
jgi:hypothetical protein